MNFIEIQTWPEVPQIAFFSSLFSRQFNLPQFDIEVSFKTTVPVQRRHKLCFYFCAMNILYRYFTPYVYMLSLYAGFGGSSFTRQLGE